MTSTIRQPIVTIAGHVDHGKTSILDKIRGTSVAEAEAGGITQKISFTLFPDYKIREACPIFSGNKIKLEIPGFLFIDTPGHAAFTNLRSRGGSLADLAILVIDLNEGIKPQTAEVLKIFKTHKTPFIIALNKIDAISGWRRIDNDLKRNLEAQSQHVKQVFDERLYTLMGALNSHGFNSELYFNVEDFAKKIVLVPCSAKTGEGISDLLMMLCGLSQKFLKKRLEMGKKARGVILEIKKEKSIQYAETIIYDGILNIDDTIAIARFGEGNEEPIMSRIRTLEEIQPLSTTFKPVKTAAAATGIRMQLTEKAEVLPGMPFVIFENNLEEIKKEFKKELSETLRTDKEGIIVKADSLGSLEAVLTLLRQANIHVLKASIGKINKSDVISAKANLETDKSNAVILGFNVDVEEDAKEIITKNIKLVKGEVVYSLINELEKWQQEKRNEILRERLMKLATITKLEILPQHVFRNSNPAVFGVKVMGGKIKSGLPLINEKAEKVGRIKNIQSENKTVTEATKDMEVAISIPGQNFERKLKEIKNLYSDISKKQLREFKKNKDILSAEELKILQEISNMKGF